MPEQIVDLSDALRTWIYKNGITVRDFSEVMGYTYSHAWGLSARKGARKFTTASWGRFIVAYGLAAFREVCSLAKVDLEKAA